MSGEKELDQEQVIETTVESELGAPDLSNFIDDASEPDISFVSDNPNKAKVGLKPSFMVKKFMPPIFGIVAKAKGSHWLLSQDELDEFTEAIDECIDYYYPDLESLPPWLALAASGGMILAPRIMIDSMSDEQKEQVKKAMSEVETDVNNATE